LFPFIITIVASGRRHAAMGALHRLAVCASRRIASVLLGNPVAGLEARNYERLGVVQGIFQTGLT